MISSKDTCHHLKLRHMQYDKLRCIINLQWINHESSVNAAKYMRRKEKSKNVLTFYFLGSFPLIQLLIMNCLVAWSKLYLHFSFLFFSNSSLMRISRFLLNPWKIWSKMSRQGCQGCHLPILAEMQQDQRIWSISWLNMSPSQNGKLLSLKDHILLGICDWAYGLMAQH